MKYLIKCVYKSKSDYAMFMLHSSEMMPNCNPTFVNEEAIEKMYSDTNALFSYAKELGFEGVTLKQYKEIWSEYNER